MAKRILPSVMYETLSLNKSLALKLNCGTNGVINITRFRSQSSYHSNKTNDETNVKKQQGANKKQQTGFISKQTQKNYSMIAEALNLASPNSTTTATTTPISVQTPSTNSNEPTVNSDNKKPKNTSYSNGGKKRSELSEARERFNQIRFFYADPEIDKAADKPLIRLNPMAMMYMAVSDDDSHLLQSANYLRNELPIRLSHMIKELRNLPFIVAVNPSMLEIHERCVKTFRKFDNFDKEIKDLDTEKKFIELVWEMLEMNKDVLAFLCDGFKDSRRYIRNEDFIKTNLNKILSARLGLRLLCEHHFSLSKQSYRKKQLKTGELVNDGLNPSNDDCSFNQSQYDLENWVGIINKRFSPKRLIENCGRLVTRVCLDKYGISPKLKIDGHTNASFPYLPLPLEYIIPELLKNSFRATCEQHRESSQLPDVNVTIAMNEKDFIFRIRDRGGGIPHNLTSKIFDYHFTTAGDESNKDNSDQLNTSSNVSLKYVNQQQNDQTLDANAIGVICEASSSRGLAVMHGYGFGLPTSKAYAEYLGGSLTFQSMQGIGSDFYLRLALLDTEPEMVRI